MLKKSLSRSSIVEEVFGELKKKRKVFLRPDQARRPFTLVSDGSRGPASRSTQVETGAAASSNHCLQITLKNSGLNITTGNLLSPRLFAGDSVFSTSLFRRPR